MTELILDSAAKINWTLEVLGRRPDGYHEVRTIMQTIGLTDQVSVSHADQLSLEVHLGTSGFRRHARENPESNLAYRAAQALKHLTGYDKGAAIKLYKHIPIASGLGGGSSNAAAVLRGLRLLWSLDIDDQSLEKIASELGSDVPFFLYGGTALASGRGEVVEPLPDSPKRGVWLAWFGGRGAVQNDKTTQMYAALNDEHYTDGSRTRRVCERIRQGVPIDEDDLQNVFEAVLASFHSGASRLVHLANPYGKRRFHLCGSGPALYILSGPESAISASAGVLRESGVSTIMTPDTLTAAESLRFEELP